ARTHSKPSLVHVVEMTQPQGHSTSGSHERYKSEERLKGEDEFDCNRRMKEWLIESGMASAQELDDIETQAKNTVRQEQKRAWTEYRKNLQTDLDEAIHHLRNSDDERADIPLKTLLSSAEPSLKEVYVNVRSEEH